MTQPTINWHIGTMGFAYKQWNGPFYPAGMPSRSYLAHYSSHFASVEVDSTFYGPPRETQVQRWRMVTPPNFRFCLKTPRQITQEKRLHNAEGEMDHFVAQARLLGEKLGVILIQLPPSFTIAQQRTLARFLQRLPQDVRFGVEFRDSSWEREETAVLLRQHNVCWVATDYIHLQKVVRPTADFIYLRFIGPHGQFATKDKELIDQTAILQQWHRQLQQQSFTDGFAYFNNDFSGFSPKTANRFKALVGQETAVIQPPTQGKLF